MTAAEHTIEQTYPPTGHPAPRARLRYSGGVRDRLLARLCADALDRAIADGLPSELDRAIADDDPSEARGARAARAVALMRPAVAHELGDQLMGILETAQRPQTMPGMRVIGAARNEVLAAEDAIRTLADRLQSGEPLDVQGIAKVRVLLRDGSGPMFHAGSDTTLSDAIQDAASAL
jgi:hypothetical protein